MSFSGFFRTVRFSQGSSQSCCPWAGAPRRDLACFLHSLGPWTVSISLGRHFSWNFLTSQLTQELFWAAPLGSRRHGETAGQGQHRLGRVRWWAPLLCPGSETGGVGGEAPCTPGPHPPGQGPMSGNKPLATGEGAQMGTQGAACGIQPSADEWVRGTEARGPLLCKQMSGLIFPEGTGTGLSCCPLSRENCSLGQT